MINADQVRAKLEKPLLWLLLVGCASLLPFSSARAVVQFQKVFESEYLVEHPDQGFAKFVKRKARCLVCHQGKGNKQNNVFGAHLAERLDHKKDKKNKEKIAEAIREVAKLPFNPEDPQSDTFAQRIAASKLPGGELEELSRPKPTEEIVLFDGESLEGWIGSTDSYVATEGVLASLSGKSGNLYTKQQYANFVLSFDFKLTPGANNGIGIRTPPKGDAAYQGIELQVLDNSAERYSNLEPYQFHGSAYGIAPAKRGHLKPVGEWNSQVVRCEGSKIQVTLNSQVILDVDLKQVAPQGKTIDGRQHPGLQRKSGHIGLLGHGSVVEYRNLKIQPLSEVKAKGPSDEKKLKE